MLWKFVFKPLLFQLSGESAHHLTLNSLKWVCKIPGVRAIIKWLFSPSPSRVPIHFFGLDFKHEVGLAAGLDKDGKYIEELTLFGFSHIEIGTVTPKPQPGNPLPRLFRLPYDKALINRMGFNNEGAQAMAQRLKKLNKPNDLILGINIGKNKDTPIEEAENDYLSCFETLFPYADYFTINISSPNTPGLRGLQAKEPLIKLLAAIQGANKTKPHPKPILVKLAPDLDDEQLAETKEILLAHQVDGIIMGNTTLDRTHLKTSEMELNHIGAGGLSGQPLTDKSTQKLRYLKSLPGEIPVIGVGGIMDGKSGAEKIEAGASLIQIYTGFIYEGPGLIKSIIAALRK